jgi:hypothetical protein
MAENFARIWFIKSTPDRAGSCQAEAAPEAARPEVGRQGSRVQPVRRKVQAQDDAGEAHRDGARRARWPSYQMLQILLRL